jgi:hypoxanthine phosphoribosyltransferase
MMKDKKIREFISSKELEILVNELAGQIMGGFAEELKSGELNFITVLEGAFPFSRDLIKKVSGEGGGIKINDYFIKLNSYSGTKSTGEICIVKDLNDNLEGRKVLIIEDIVDSGQTINFLREYLLNQKKVEEVRVVSLLSKPSRRICEVDIDYLGKEIPDKFVIGYGLDFDGKYRNLDFLGILD